MNKSLTYCCFLILIFSTSCKTQKRISTDLTKEDLVYQAVIKHEIEELGDTFVVVDRSKEKCLPNNNLTNIDFIANENLVYWKKSLFKTLEYVNGDTVYQYSMNDIEKYKNIRSARGAKGWFELSSPCFTEDNDYALIKVDFGRTLPFNNSNYYLLKRNSNGYRILKSIKITL